MRNYRGDPWSANTISLLPATVLIEESNHCRCIVRCAVSYMRRHNIVGDAAERELSDSGYRGVSRRDGLLKKGTRYTPTRRHSRDRSASPRRVHKMETIPKKACWKGTVLAQSPFNRETTSRLTDCELTPRGFLVMYEGRRTTRSHRL